MLIACRRTTLIAGTAMQDIQNADVLMARRPSTRFFGPLEPVLSWISKPHVMRHASVVIVIFPGF